MILEGIVMAVSMLSFSDCYWPTDCLRLYAVCIFRDLLSLDIGLPETEIKGSTC